VSSLRLTSAFATRQLVRDLYLKDGTLLRHSSTRLTLNLYTHTVSQQRRDANNKVTELLMPEQALNAQHLSAPSPQ